MILVSQNFYEYRYYGDILNVSNPHFEAPNNNVSIGLIFIVNYSMQRHTLNELKIMHIKVSLIYEYQYSVSYGDPNESSIAYNATVTFFISNSKN